MKLYAEQSEEEWCKWLQLFKDEAIVVLGYIIGDQKMVMNLNIGNNATLKL